MRKVRSTSTGWPLTRYGLYRCCSSALIAARSMNGSPWSTRQLCTPPSTVIRHFTIIVPCTSCSSAWFVYKISGPLSLIILITLFSASIRFGGGPVPVPPSDPPTTPPTTPPSTPPSTPSSSSGRSGTSSGGFSSSFGNSFGCTICVDGVLGTIFGVCRGVFGLRAAGGGGEGHGEPDRRSVEHDRDQHRGAAFRLCAGSGDVVEHESSAKGGGDYLRPLVMSTS